MNDFTKRLLGCFSASPHDLEKGEQVAEGVQALYKKKIRRAVIECYLRLAGAAAVTVYGAIGIRYNTGRYVDWALFTAMVGFVSAAMIILWYWQLQAKLSIQREIKQLRLEISRLLEDKQAQSDIA